MVLEKKHCLEVWWLFILAIMTLHSAPLSAEQDNEYEGRLLGGSDNGFIGKIDDEFAVTPLGQSDYRIPLPVLPGTGDVVPKLSISYNSSTKEGLLGYGFDLTGLSVISRTPKNRFNDGCAGYVSFSESDCFALDGARLIRKSSSSQDSTSVYSTEINSFSKIVSHGPLDNPTSFIIHTKDGLTYEYTRNTTLRGGSMDEKALFWMLTKVSDTKGNYFTVSYVGNSANTADHAMYPVRIDYTGNANASLAPYASVRIEYITAEDASVTYVHGRTVTRKKRISAVKLYYGDSIQKTYQMDYVSVNGRWFLSELTEKASDGTKKNPTRFDWHNVYLYHVSKVSNTSFSTHNNSILTVGDYNGDGKADLLATPKNGNTSRYWRLFLSQGSSFGYVKSGYLFSDNILQAAKGDFNGDGYDDFVLLRHFQYDSNSPINYTITLYLSRVQNGKFITFDNAGNIYSTNNRISLGVIEANGDGLSDLFVCNHTLGRYRVYKSQPGSPLSVYVTYNAPSGCDWERTEFVDVNGDGLTDVMSIQQNGIHLLTNTGSGVFSNSTVGYTSLYDIHFGDYNADGKTDMLMTGYSGMPWDRWQLHLSDGTGDYNHVKYLNNMPQLSNTQVFPTDINGDGFDDFYTIGKTAGVSSTIVPIVYMNDGNGSFYRQSTGVSAYPLSNSYYYLGDFNGDGKTDLLSTADWENSSRNGYDVFRMPENNTNLLSTITDGLGNQTSITYKYMSDTTVHVRGRGTDYPLISMGSSWPVVSAVTTPDGIGGTDTISYRYKNAMLHRDGRGVLGFEYFIKKDLTNDITTTTRFQVDSTRYVLGTGHTETVIGNRTVSTTDIVNELQEYGQGVFRFQPKTETVRTYEYNTGELLSESTSSFEYDQYGNVTKTTVAKGDVVTTTTNTFTNDTVKWHLGRLVDSHVTKSGSSATQYRHSSFSYDPQSGLLTTESTEPDSVSTGYCKTYIRDIFGNITSSRTRPNDTRYAARTDSTTYDAKGRFLVSQRNALGHTQVNTVSQSNGLLLSTTDPNGVVTTFAYDSFGNCTQKTLPYMHVRHLRGWSAGLSDSPSNALYFGYQETTGEPFSLEYYDCLGRVVRKVTESADGRKVYVDIVYNRRGQIEKTSEPYFAGGTRLWTTFEYDKCGRIVRETLPNGSCYQTSYGGFTTTVTDPLGHTSSKTVDANGLLVESKDAMNNTVTYEYDVNGQCTKMTGPRTAIRMQYDLMGNQTRMDDPDLGTVNTTYNAYGEITSQTDARGTTTFTYDKLGRVVSENRPDMAVSNVYDSNYIGTLTYTIANNGTCVDYEYDAYGRNTCEVTSVNGRGFTTRKTYNAQNKVDVITYPSGLKVRNTYSANGYLQTVANADNNSLYWSIGQVNERGQILSENLGNGLVSTTSYDVYTGRVVGLMTPGIQNWTYAYNNVGNLIYRTDVSNQLEETFGYDELGRLTWAKRNGTVYQNVSYDAAGNILSKTGVGHGFTYADSTNRIASYSPDGILPKLWNSISYSSFHKITHVSQGNRSLSITYGPDKTRFMAVSDNAGTTETKYYAGGLYELSVRGSETIHTCYIFAGGKAIAILRSSNTNGVAIRYLHHDHLGSIQAYSNENGQLVQQLSYDAWGRRRDPATWDYYDSMTDARAWQERGFCGHEHLDLFEMVNMDGRMYDPIMGRFLSPDPYMQAPDLTQGLNRYSYCLNNPLSLTDPSGYSWLSDNWRSLVGAAVGIAVGALTAGAGATVGVAILAGAAGGAAGALTGALLNGANIGQVAKATFTGAFWGAVGGSLNFISADEELLAKLFKHTFTQGFLEGVQGGNVYHGFMMGAVSSAGGHFIDKYANSMGKLGEITANAVLSGTVDEIGGGKFANGAVTGAFAIMFNDMMHENSSRRNEIEIDNTKDNTFLATLAIGAGVVVGDDATGIGVIDDVLLVGIATAYVAYEGYELICSYLSYNKDAIIVKAEHTKGARPSTRQKHTKTRAGSSYGKQRNQNRGYRNRKYEHPQNPNKKKK